MSRQQVKQPMKLVKAAAKKAVEVPPNKVVKASAKKTGEAVPKKEDIIVQDNQVRPNDVKELQSFPLSEKFLNKMGEIAQVYRQAKDIHDKDLGMLVEGFLSDKELKGGENARVIFDFEGKRIVEIE